MIIEEALVGNPGFESIENEPVVLSQSTPSFDDVVRQLPQLSTKVGESFKKIFQVFSVKSVSTEEDLSEAFTEVMSQGSSIVNALPDSVCNEVFIKFPDIDLREAIFNYIEMNVYDRLWARYLEISPDKDDDIMNEAYSHLNNLSLSQSGLPTAWLLDPDRLTSLSRRVLLAIAEFKRLQFASTSSEQCKILCKTIGILSDGGGSDAIDADTLISLFIMVVAHAAVTNLNRHLQYIRGFSFGDEDSLETGLIGYALSSFEAVLNYYNESENLKQMKEYSDSNKKLWDMLKANDIDGLKHLIDPFKEGTNVAADSFLRSRTLHGESCLMLALEQDNSDVFDTLMSYDNIFTLDDILEDRTIDGLSLLSCSLQQKHPATKQIADIILQADNNEIVDYCNSLDSRGRNLGHFLFHNYKLIPMFGQYIDWRVKDSTGKTPFFTMVRCYDHPNYDELVALTIKSVDQWYKSQGINFTYRDHIDSRGNTLVHAIKDGNSLKLFLDEFDCLDVNCLNSNKQTPLMQYVRYNRLSNVETILKDRRLDLLRSDDQYQLIAEDYIKVERMQDPDDASQRVNRLIMDVLDDDMNRRYSVTVNGQSCCALRAKFDTNRELCLYFKSYGGGGQQATTVIHSYGNFVKFIKLLKLLHPVTYIGDDDGEVWLPSYTLIDDQANVNYSKKLRMNRLLLHTNMLLTCIRLNPSLRDSELCRDFLSVQKPLDEMYYVKKKQSENESARRKITEDGLGNIRVYLLRPEDVGNYRTFLKFSGSELSKLMKSLDRLYRMVSFVEIKYADLGYVEDNLEYFAADTIKREEISGKLDCLPYERLEEVCERMREIHGLENVSCKEIFCESIMILRECVGELTGCISKFIQTKISRWWKLYGEIKEVGDELVRILKAARRAKGSNDKGVINGTSITSSSIDQILLEIGTLIGSIDDSSAKELEAKISTSSDSGDLFEGSGGYLSGIIEKRRRDYTMNLIEGFRRQKNEMINLNLDLKKEYEDLCIEISNFYEFREGFIKYAFRQLAKGELEVLRLQKEVMMAGRKG
ncbi:DEKNAAC103272 [Brettanomyces naardenensis]|uniref:DEKNAAC103272 n=1 Tax=Brettanomyces naardenensis TaxID=13370 RepID=A0A448YMX2_BRENA|nr:DEKNAAC103272 [Brettanomyces naardenensis]